MEEKKFEPVRYVCTRYDGIQIDLPPVEQVTNINGRQVIQMRSPGTLVFKGGNYTAKRQIEVETIEKSTLFGNIIKRLPPGAVKPERPGSPVVGQISTQNVSVPNKPKEPVEKILVTSRDEVVAQLCKLPNFNIGVMAGKNFDEAVRMANLDYKLNLVVGAQREITPQPKTKPEAPQANAIGTAPQEFASRNDLVAFLVKEKGVNPEALKGKKADEVVALAKEAHGIDVVIKKS